MLSEASFVALRNLVRSQAAIQLDPDKSYLAEARLSGLAQVHAQGDINVLVEMVHQASSQNPLLRQVVEAMAIHETFFFRDPILETSLIEHLIPAAIKRNAESRTLNIWCAACSTGQEAYSVMILLREHFPELADWKIHFVVSDFSRAALARAAEGSYAINEVNRGLPAKLLMKYFEQQGLKWSVKKALKSSMEFREINLVGIWPDDLPLFDIVLLRNVMIYFDAPTRQEVLKRVRFQTQPHGFLLLGATENLSVGNSYRNYPEKSPRPCYQKQ